MPRRANGSSESCRAPGKCGSSITSESLLASAGKSGAGEQQEARVILAAVFQMLAENDSTVLFRRTFAGDSPMSGIAFRHNPGHAAGCILCGYAPDLRICRQKAPALVERHRMRLNRGQPFER